MTDKITRKAEVGTTTFTIERSALGQVAEYDVFVSHQAGTPAQDRMYLGGGTKREATSIFNRAVGRADVLFAHAQRAREDA